MTVFWPVPMVSVAATFACAPPPKVATVKGRSDPRSGQVDDLARGMMQALGIPGLSLAVVQNGDPCRTAIDRRHHLDIVDGVQAEFLGDALGDDLKDPVRRTGCILRREEEEIAFAPALRELRELSPVDQVGIRDDLRMRRLAENGAQAPHRHHTAVDQVTQHIPRAD